MCFGEMEPLFLNMWIILIGNSHHMETEKKTAMLNLILFKRICCKMKLVPIRESVGDVTLGMRIDQSEQRRGGSCCLPGRGKANSATPAQILFLLL